MICHVEYQLRVTCHMSCVMCVTCRVSSQEEEAGEVGSHSGGSRREGQQGMVRGWGVRGGGGQRGGLVDVGATFITVYHDIKYADSTLENRQFTLENSR